MKKEEIERRVFDKLNDRNGTSFVEIEEIFERNGFDYNGNQLICTTVSAEHNIFFWAGWNEEAIRIFNNAHKRSNAEYIPTSHLLYVMDGKVPNFPIAKQARKYKEWHWLPVVLSAKE